MSEKFFGTKSSLNSEVPDEFVQRYSRKELYYMHQKDSALRYLEHSVRRLKYSVKCSPSNHQSKRDIFMNKHGRKYVTNYGGCKRVAPEYYQLKKEIYNKYSEPSL